MKKVTLVLAISVLISFLCLKGFSQEDNKPTLIIFHADWCKHCQTAKEDINKDKELSETIKNYYVVMADYDVDKDLVEGYNVKKIPTFVIIKNSKSKSKVGYKGPKDLDRFLQDK